MQRYWISFWADDPRSIGGDPGHTFFCTGYRDTEDDKGTCSMCVLAEGESFDAIWSTLKSDKFYPEAEQRFAEAADASFKPNSGGRFPSLLLWQVATPQQPGPLVA
ncbi:hypothetical protein SAMN06269173_11179 [Hymenobacter mucosus]|uniref:Uncharacterized protein n=1 Tax=Hymenobacter mucosus TaxID=1411120 RepID=A0A239A951_9BACT|nr:hypothetical protein SAMN06269173_11179 [Hymenobacter mucosus]